MVRRFPFEGARKLNLGSGYVPLPASEGWVNMDGYIEHPDIVKHDMVKFPYPFEDSSFDLVYASHVLEHIPVLFTDWKGTERDVLFTFMEEIHRILKPGGRLHLLVPLGGTDMAVANPQHYRDWHPTWFRFFDQSSAEGSGYHDADFQLEKITFNRLGYRLRHSFRLGKSGLGLTEHLVIRFPKLFAFLQPKHEMEAVLVARK